MRSYELVFIVHPDLDDGDLQRVRSSVVMVQKVPTISAVDVPSRDSGKRRHVVRAICDRGDQPSPRLSAVQLGLLQTDLGGCGPVRWQHRAVLDAYVAVLPIPSDHCRNGTQGGPVGVAVTTRSDA